MDLRTIEPWDYRTFGLSSSHHCVYPYPWELRISAKYLSIHGYVSVHLCWLQLGNTAYWRTKAIHGECLHKMSRQDEMLQDTETFWAEIETQDTQFWDRTEMLSILPETRWDVSMSRCWDGNHNPDFGTNLYLFPLVLYDISNMIDNPTLIWNLHHTCE